VKRITVTLALLPLVFFGLAIGIQDFAVPLGIAWLLCSVACLVWGICIVRIERRGGWLCIAWGCVNLALIFLPVLLPAHRVASHL